MMNNSSPQQQVQGGAPWMTNGALSNTLGDPRYPPLNPDNMIAPEYMEASTYYKDTRIPMPLPGAQVIGDGYGMQQIVMQPRGNNASIGNPQMMQPREALDAIAATPTGLPVGDGQFSMLSGSGTDMNQIGFNRGKPPKRRS